MDNVNSKHNKEIGLVMHQVLELEFIRISGSLTRLKSASNG